MTRIIAIANQKGGVGKTTTALNLAHALAEHHQRVLLVDFDGQCSLTVATGNSVEKAEPRLAEVITGQRPLDDVVNAIQPTGMEGVDILPATPDLAAAEIALVNAFKREDMLSNALDAILRQRPHYDIVLIDCPPNLGLLTTNALVAAHHVLIPLESDYLAFRGAQLIVRTIRAISAQNGGRPQILGVIVTKHDKRTKHGEEMLAEIERVFTGQVLRPVIPHSVTARDAVASHLSVISYKPKSNVAMAFQDLARKILMHYVNKAS